ncbi:tRNA-specific adenosine deaminase 1 [Fusarium oxysporum f. sp. albedinis]|nr:tRNA-specific adenosine deaminase 1 [Fusarium oxysporum f. sp. albedinis]
MPSIALSLVTKIGVASWRARWENVHYSVYTPDPGLLSRPKTTNSSHVHFTVVPKGLEKSGTFRRYVIDYVVAVKKRRAIRSGLLTMGNCSIELTHLIILGSSEAQHVGCVHRVV